MDRYSSSNVSIPDNGTIIEEDNRWSRILVASTMSPIIVLGTIGNVLSLLVWVKVRRCKSSTACFLAGLAVADSFALLISGMNFWTVNVMETDLRYSGTFACKFLVYVDFSAQFSSAWIIVVVASERTFAVWFPHKFKQICQPVKARLLLLVTVVALLVICLPFLLSADIASFQSNETSNKHVCVFTDNSTLVKDEVTWFYVEMVFHFVLPFVIIVVTNSSILVKVAFLAINRKRSPDNLDDRKKDDTRYLKNVSVRIIVLSIAFCLGVGPIHLYGYKETLEVEQLAKASNDQYRTNKHSEPLYISFVILMYLNNAINFFLYCLIGSGFRKDLLKLFRRRQEQYPIVSV